jgi:hypothetical protein
MAKHPKLVMTADKDGTPVLILDGVKIAERGQPNSPQRGRWVSLEPGYTIHDSKTDDIVVEYNGVRVQ